MDQAKTLLALNLGRIGGNQGLGPFGNLSPYSISPAADAFAQVLSTILGFLTIVAGLWFFLKLFLAGFEYMQAEGDAQKVKTAWGKITTNITGLVIVVASYALVSLIGKIMGFDILNPQETIRLVRPGLLP